MRGYGIGVNYPDQIIVPRTCLIRAINVINNKFITIPIQTFVLDSIVVSVSQGTFKIWFGDYSGDNLPSIPHLQYDQGNEISQLWLPGLGKGVHTVTVGGGDLFANPSTGTVILSGESNVG
jgi:hypothetical protein